MIEIRGMHSEELPSVHRILDQAFPNTAKSFFDRQVKNDPVLRPEDTRVLLENGKVRACVRVYFRELYCQGEIIKIGGIGDVGTDPSHQHRGYASQLMEDAIQYMRNNGVLLSLLFTQINPFFYSFGYMDLPTLSVEAEPLQRRFKIEYRTANIRTDLTELQKLYSDYNRNKTGPAVRNAHYWKQQMKFPRIDPCLFWVTEENGTIQCYIRGKIETDYLKIQEWAHRPGEEECVLNLIHEMTRVTHKKKVYSRYLSKQEATLFTKQPLAERVAFNSLHGSELKEGPDPSGPASLGSRTIPKLWGGSKIKQWPCHITEDRTSMVRLIQLDKHASFRNIVSPHHFLFWESDRF